MFADGGVLVQFPVVGQLVMIQSVFCAAGLSPRTPTSACREGASGGASHKQSIDLPEVREHLRTLGSRLAWHGPLSADAMLTHDGPVYIDINPRLVEPGNAWRAGVDLVATLLDLACGTDTPDHQPGRTGSRPTSCC